MKVLIRKLAARLQRLSPLTITAIGLCCALALGTPDCFTPGPMSFVLFHVLVVVFVGWGAGKWNAVVVSGVAVATMATAQWYLHRNILPPGWVFIWNNSMRFIVLSIAGWLTAEVTRLNRNLGRLVEERTAQWEAEAEQHKATSTRLAEALERFEQVVGNITEVFWLTDVAKGQMAYISPGYERIWGRKCEELYREPRSWVAAVHPAERDEVLRRAQTEQATGSYDVEYRIIRPDGAMRWIRDRAFPVRNEQGQVYRIAGIADDITERKQTRELLQTQAAILENMAEGVVVTDEQGMIVQMNPAGERIWGYERNEVLGQPVSMLSALPELEAKAVMGEVLEALRATGSWRGTFQNRRKDGALISCEAIINRVEIQDRMLLVAVEQDVTERVRVQEQLQMQARVLASMAEAVMMVDENGTIVLTNSAQDALLGYERGELAGQPMHALAGVSVEAHNRNFKATVEQVRTGGSSAGDYLARRKDGSFIEVETRSSGVSVGGRFYLVMVGQDITERKKREEALRQSEATLRVFLNAVPEPAFLLDRNGTILVSNQALARRLGLPEGDLIGKDPLDLIPSNLAESRRAMFDQVVRSREAVRFEDSREGQHCLNFESPVLDSAGNVTRVAVFAFDITERKQAELTKEVFLSLGAKLGAASSPVEAARAVYAAADQLWKWDAATLVLYSQESDSMEPVLYRDVVDGQRCDVPAVLPDGAPMARMRRIMQQGAELVLRREGDLQDTESVRFGDSSRVSASIMGVPLRQEGRAVGVLSIQSYTPDAYSQEDLQTLQALADYGAGALERIRAEQALQQREELNRTILVTALDGFFALDFATDPQGAITEVNEAYCHLTGYSREELLQMRIADLEAKEGPEDVARHKARIMTTGADRFETRHRRKDGEVVYVEISVFRLADGSERTFGFVREITERKRAELMKEAFLSLGAKLSGVGSPVEAARAVFASADQFWKWDAATLDLYSAERDWMEPVLFCDVIDGQRREVAPVSPAGSPPGRLVRIMREGAELILRQPAEMERTEFVRFGDASRLSASLMYVALRREGRAVGVLSIQSYTANAYTQEDLRTLQALADHCAGALERIYAEAALHEAHDKLEQRVQERTAELEAANAALAANEARLELALDASRAGTWSWDAASHASRWDDRYHALYGFESHEAMSFDAWIGRVHPEDRERLLARIQALLEPGGGDIWNEEFRALHPEKGERWMAGLGRIERDQAGRAVRVAGINLDITERKVMDRALQESEQRYRRLHESITDAFVSVDMNGRIIEFNPAYEALLGYTAEELRQQTYVGLTPEKWHAFERSIVAEQVLPRGHSDVYEKEYRRKDGTILPVELRTFLIRDASGQPAGMWAIVRDITERKAAEEALREGRDKLEARVKERTAELEAANAALGESEERYRSLVNNLNVGVYRNTPGPQGRFIQANPALARMHGYDSVEEFQRIRVADLYQEPGARKEFVAELLRQGAVADYELRLKKRDGTAIYGSVNATVHRGPDGEVDWIDGMIEDITERKQAEARLQAQRDLGISLSLTSNLNAALKSLLEITMQMGGVDSGGVYLLNQATGEMDLAVHHGVSLRFVKAVLHWAADSLQMGLMLQGRSVFAPYGSLPIAHDEARRSEGLRATALVPLYHDSHLIGALALCSHQTDEIPRGTQLVVEAIAAQAVGAIARVRAETERHRLEQQILEISDREQARIGQDIHDGLCQQLVSLAFDANSLEGELSRQQRPEAATARRIAGFLDQAITETRQLSRGLFPIRLEAEGLVPALEELAKATRERFQIGCRVTSKKPVVVENRITATHLYRIAQEAVTNAVKHSQARKVAIRLRDRAGGLELSVEDDGAGLPAAKPKEATGLGLHIMDYRARSIGGTLRLAPGSRGGTTVSCCVPRPLR
jgi:PAS domain S-box-containing protein